jgi:hypothetical protein
MALPGKAVVRFFKVLSAYMCFDLRLKAFPSVIRVYSRAFAVDFLLRYSPK